MAAEKIYLSQGDYLMREGEEGDAMYYLEKGTLGIYKRKGDREGQIGTVYKGEVVGEMSFLDSQKRSATVKAVTDCELLEIPHEKFIAFFNKLPKWYQALINTLLDRLRKANSRIKV